MANPKYKTAYDYPNHMKVEIDATQGGMTKQSMQEECDINKIMAKFQRTGNVSHLNKYEGKYGDATSIDLHSAMNVVTNAHTMFNELPSETRTKFKNDPGLFLDFVQDEKNQEEMVKMGLAKATRAPDIVPEAPPAQNPEASPPES
jgi:phage internal scaffolding protein